MARAALPIKDRNNVHMNTTLPIFKGGVNTASSVLPVAIDILIQAERESLTTSELTFQKRNEISAIPSSFDSAERFCNILQNPPPAGKVLPRYNETINEYIGLLSIFACRRILGLNITSKEIDLSKDSDSALLRGLGNQLVQQCGVRKLIYFCIDSKPFAYIYKNCIIPIKDKRRYRNALISIPFFSSTKGRFNNILSATADDTDNGRMLFKQLLYAFLYNEDGTYNCNGSFFRLLGAPYLDITEQIASSWNDIPYLYFLKLDNTSDSLCDILMNAPSYELFPEKLFSDQLLLFSQINNYNPPCFGMISYEDELYNVVNPMSKEFCNAISQSNGRIVFENSDGAPDCDGSVPDTDGCVSCRIRLKIDNIKIIIHKQYYVKENCIRTDVDGNPLESINMGIDCNINPSVDVPFIFRRYIVWNCPECVSVSFDRELGVFPVVHLNDKAFVAIVEPNVRIPEFAFLSMNNQYCGCIKFPAPIDPIHTQGNSPTSIYLDFGTTNTICLVEYGVNYDYVDIKEYVSMITGSQGNADFRIFHLLSDRDNNCVIRSIAICSVSGNQFGSPLYRAHALNAGKDALQKSVEEIEKLQKQGDTEDANKLAVDLSSVNVYDNLKWTGNNLANEGYRALVGSIFSSALAKLLIAGFNPQYTTINISVPSSMDAEELELTKNRVSQALTGIRADLEIHNQHYESTAAAFYIINDSNSGITIGNTFNVGIDIGGGTIDLFSFQSKIGLQGRPIPACIDSVKNAAGRKILSETLVKAVNHYNSKSKTEKQDNNPFFYCFMSDSFPPDSLNFATDNAAICITETFIPDAVFNEDASGKTRIMLNTFRRNVLLKMIAVLNYAAEFIKVSWKKDKYDFKTAEVNILLCGNGSGVWSKKWSGIVRPDRIRIRDFFKKRIGCRTLYIQASKQPKKETVMGMKYILGNDATRNDGKSNIFQSLNPFVAPSIPVTLGGEDIATAQNYVNGLLDDIIENRLLHVSGDDNNLNEFHSLLKREVTVGRVRTALDYVLNNDDVSHKGNDIFLADVFLRFILDLPYIDPNEG